MRKTPVVLFFIVMICALLGACAKDPYKRIELRETYFEASTDDRPYLKRAAIVLKPGRGTPFAGQIETIFFQSVVDTIRDKSDRLELITLQDGGIPALSGPLSLAAEGARMQGYHYLLQAGLWGASPIKEKKGLWMFRKERGYVNLVVALDVYDTFTGAKIVSEVTDETVRISMDEYEALMAGVQGTIAEVDEAAADHGEVLGELAADRMADGRWMASVIAVDGQGVMLAAGRTAGLKAGDRLSLYEGRRVLAGQNGERFIAPGYKLGDIRIATVEETTARATLEEPADIQTGDIALPAP